MILDEPVDGLNPVMRKKVWNLILQDVAERQVSVLVSSHNLRELEDVCDHIGILHNGKIVVERELDDMKSDVHKFQLAFSTEIPAGFLEGPEVLHRTQTGSTLLLIARGDKNEMPTIHFLSRRIIHYFCCSMEPYLRDVYTVGLLMTYIIATVLFLVMGWFVYKYRKLETAGDIIAFPALYPVFKYGMTFCLMLVGGTYFCGFSRQSFPLLIIGYILGSVLGYFVAEILIHKSFKVLRFYKGYLYYSAVILILFGGISLDALGFVNRVPNPEEVNKVYFGYSFDEWIYFEKQKNPEYLEYRYGKGYFEDNKPLLFESKENIAGITELQRHLIKERKGTRGKVHPVI